VRYTKGADVGQSIAFIYDPDGYWIEILEQDRKPEHK
jgi:catechol 2,3-dioxygenase-like lactoylglutathione lyase family enzyme